MSKYVWNSKKQLYERIEETKLEKFKSWWNNVEWSKILEIGFTILVYLSFIWAVASFIYFSSPAYCEAKALTLGFKEFKFLYPECYIKTPDLGWYPLDEYLKAINLH